MWIENLNPNKSVFNGKEHLMYLELFYNRTNIAVNVVNQILGTTKVQSLSKIPEVEVGIENSWTLKVSDACLSLSCMSLPTLTYEFL